MTESGFLVNASAHFLSEEYPSEAILWGDKHRAEYCEEFRCEDYEYFTGEQLRQIIEHIAHELKTTYQRGLQDGRNN